VTYVRSFCSVRYIVKFLPNGSLAPRLNIDSNVLLSKISEYDDCDCSASDSNVLYISSYTDPINSNDDDCEIKSIKNNTGDNDNHKLIMKSKKTQYSNYRYGGKNKRGKRLKESTKNNGKLYHNNNTSDTTDSSDEHFHSSSRSNRISQFSAQESGKSSTCDLERDRFPHRPDADGESDTAIAATGSPSLMQHDETKFNNNLSESPIPSASLTSTSLILPPPPPPPPMISSPALQGGANGSSNWREQLQARLRSKKNNSTDKTSTPIKSYLWISQSPADMSEVLKELQSGSIKLRSIPRSPGGTPIKQKHSPTISGSDPCAIITRALHSKFSHLRSMMDSSTSDEEENQYMGFCPQFKYRYGHTFGKETSEIAKGSHHFYPVTRENNKFDPLRSKFNYDVPGRMLPKSTGDNKYTEGMIPGYSGNIPQMNFKFGRTYRNLSDECVDQLVKEYKSSELRQNRLKESSNLMTNLHPVTYDPLVKNHLNTWTDDMVKKNSDVHSYMSSNEPPIPESGLAKRFHEAAQSSLETFRAECKNHFDHMDMPMTRLDTSSRPHSSIPYTPNSNYYSARIFHQEGMIPDYEVHIHGYQYHVGKNFGNTTRDLEVCAHPYSCYGEYLKIKDLTKKYLS
ncbi:unnamed protein product, partial [Schistosoma rodhaini]|uniref:Ciliary microtubule inner protein 2A-C-like domain-containing protein n=1 Tax=Schistosoma rodhaini TaxID=6188 RepID=A0AA85GKH3_9TREM